VSTSPTIRFVAGSGVCAALAASALAAGVVWSGTPFSAWAAAGFVAMAAPVIAAGAWLAHEQGRSGVAFTIALGTGLVTRALLLAIVVAAAARAGGPALTAALAGLATGFAPLTAYEWFWFARRAYPSAGRSEQQA